MGTGGVVILAPPLRPRLIFHLRGFRLSAVGQRRPDLWTIKDVSQVFQSFDKNKIVTQTYHRQVSTKNTGPCARGWPHDLILCGCGAEHLLLAFLLEGVAGAGAGAGGKGPTPKLR